MKILDFLIASLVAIACLYCSLIAQENEPAKRPAPQNFSVISPVSFAGKTREYSPSPQLFERIRTMPDGGTSTLIINTDAVQPEKNRPETKAIIYPAITESQTTLYISGMKGGHFAACLYLYDVMGRMTFAVKNIQKNETCVNLEMMSAGMYLYRVEKAGETIGKGKIVIR